MHRRVAAPLSAFALSLGMAGGLEAQAAAVTVRDGAGGPPVAGALVRLLRGDSVIAQGLTGESGRITLRPGAAGRFTLRVGRIGYAASPPESLQLAPNETRSIELAVTSERIRLPEVVVRARTQCGRSSEERALAATLWEQIRQALTATRLSERSGLALRSRRVDRSLSRTGTITDERFSPSRVTGSRHLVTRAPELLAEEGYVVADGDSVVYYAPDAELLLSDPFVESHCFGVTAAAGDSSVVGLSFEPTRGRQVADIRGVLWVDRRTVELRRLEFQYLSRRNEAMVTAASGSIAFDRLPSGAWYIRSWAVRMPQIERTASGSLYRDAVAGYREFGGTAEPLGTEAGAVAPSYVTGRVWDSLAGQALPGVTVLVAGSSDTAVTDSLGRFEMALPVTGERQMTFRHPLMTLDPANGVRTVELIPAAIAQVQIGTPGVDALAGTICAAGRGKSGLVGIVLAQDSAVAGLPISAAWDSTRAGPGRAISTATGASGVWAFCDVPSGVAVRLRVGRDGTGELRPVTLEPDGFRWLSLAVGRTGRAIIASEAGQRLPELATSGSRAVAADRRFLEDARARVLRSGAPASALITRADLEKENSHRMLPLLTSRGLKTRINPKTGRESLVCAHKNERPAIYLNGLLVDGADTPGARRLRLGLLSEVFDLENLPPETVEAVEVYRSMSQRPPEFNRTLQECVVVIWTRRGGS